MLAVACAIEVAAQAEQRRHPRLAALRGAKLRSRQSGVVTGAITDLSVGGCRVATRGHFVVGTRVCLRIEGLQSWWGTVAWREGVELGIAFEAPLHPAVIEHIARTTPR